MRDPDDPGGPAVFWGGLAILAYSVCLVEVLTRWVQAHQLFDVLVRRFI